MTIEEKLKDLIIKEYKSLRQFAPLTGLPYTTVNAILKRGILNSNVQNVFKICEVLGISADALRENKIVKIDKDNEAPDGQKNSINIDNKRYLQLYRKLFDDLRDIEADGEALSESDYLYLLDGMEIVIETLKRKRDKEK